VVASRLPLHCFQIFEEGPFLITYIMKLTAEFRIGNQITVPCFAYPGSAVSKMPPLITYASIPFRKVAQFIMLQVLRSFLQEGGVQEAKPTATGTDFFLHPDYVAQI
jgi:hypothetical protein